MLEDITDLLQSVVLIGLTWLVWRLYRPRPRPHGQVLCRDEWQPPHARYSRPDDCGTCSLERCPCATDPNAPCNPPPQ